MKFAIRRPSASMVVAIVALVVAMAGTSYAALTLPKNSVGSKQLRAGAVTNAKLANGAVTAAKLNTAGLTVPNALNAAVAGTATTAASAATANNATELGGNPASDYEPHVMWAYVTATGNVIEASTTGISVVAHGVGTYIVQFPQSAEGKAIEVTPHDDENDKIFSAIAAPCGSDNTPAEISCTSYNTPTHVYVSMYDTIGYVNNGFYIAVMF